MADLYLAAVAAKTHWPFTLIVQVCQLAESPQFGTVADHPLSQASALHGSTTNGSSTTSSAPEQSKS